VCLLLKDVSYYFFRLAVIPAPLFRFPVVFAPLYLPQSFSRMLISGVLFFFLIVTSLGPYLSGFFSEQDPCTTSARFSNVFLPDIPRKVPPRTTLTVWPFYHKGSLGGSFFSLHSLPYLGIEAVGWIPLRLFPPLNSLSAAPIDHVEASWNLLRNPFFLRSLRLEGPIVPFGIPDFSSSNVLSKLLFLVDNQIRKFCYFTLSPHF